MTTIPGGLITLEYAAAGLNITDVGVPAQAARDADLTLYVQSATAVIEDLVGPVLPVTKTVTFDGGVVGIVLPDRVTAVTSVTEAGNLLPSSNWFLDPIANIIYGGNTIYPRPFYPGRLAVSVVYTTGFTIVPPTLQLATRELVRFWWQQGKAAQRPAYSDAVEATPPQGFAVPKRVIELCNSFIGAEVGFA